MSDGLHVRLVNAFVAAASSVLGQTMDEMPGRGTPAFRYVGRAENQVTVVVGVVGPAYGQIKFGMSLVTAARIASHMTGRPTDAFDARVSEAVSLLAERICGDAMNRLAGDGLALAAMDPTVLRGDEIEPTGVTAASIVVPFRMSCGAVSLAVALKLPQATLLPPYALTRPALQPSGR